MPLFQSDPQGRIRANRQFFGPGPDGRDKTSNQLPNSQDIRDVDRNMERHREPVARHINCALVPGTRKMGAEHEIGADPLRQFRNRMLRKGG